MTAQEFPLDDTFRADTVQPMSSSSESSRGDPAEDGVSTVPSMMDTGTAAYRRRAYISISILCFINLLNYMDRFTIAGVLDDVKSFYGISDTWAGLLQTAFVCSYMVLAPIFGYMGDRFNRKLIVCAGITFWSLTTLAGSVIPKDHFWAFILLRGLVGVGEASYSTIAPTIIADLFTGALRTKMLMVFYFAIPVGSGMGYIIGSSVAKAANQWQWALRVTPGLGILSVVLTLFVLREPKRGAAEGSRITHNTNWSTDLKELLKNKSFMWSTVGFTFVTFVSGALAWWAPLFMNYALRVQLRHPTMDTVALIFGALTCAAGFIGVALGSFVANWYKKYNPRADPLVCAFGLLTCTPFLYLVIVLSRHYEIPTWVCIFLGEVLLCLNWAIVADILLYVVIPTRRSTAEAFQILLSHALGDAASPYIIGTVSDAFKGNRPETSIVQYESLQMALYITTFVAVLAGAAFLVTAFYIEKDRKEAEKVTKGSSESPQSTSTKNLLVNGENGSINEQQISDLT